jgi:predicted RNase H-like HicB family nuclease
MKASAKKTETPAMLARRYLKLVEWSDVDGCFVGSAPPIIGPCCHGRTEAEVMAQLSVIVEEWVEIMLGDGHPLPPGTAGKKYSGQFVVRIAPELHKKASLKALARGESLNQFVAAALAEV